MIHCIQPHFHTGIPISIPHPMSIATDPSSANAAEHGCAEFMLFGVRVKIDPMRKCVSMNNLSDYTASNPTEKSTHEFPKSTAAVGSSAAGVGYASADDVARLPSSRRRDRKRGVPWTEEEHKLFLIGLQEVGKGEWRGISKNYVKTRTPTQVASHAQKYFIRQSNMKRRRQRSSLFDMTTVSITSMATEERKTRQDSPANGFPIAPFPLASSHIQSSMQRGNLIENAECYRGIDPSSAAMFVNPAPILPSPTYSSTLDLNIDHSVPSLSLTLSLAPRQDEASTPEPIFRAIPGFRSGSNIISVS